MMNNLVYFLGWMNKIIHKVLQKILVKSSQCGNDIARTYNDIFVILLNFVLSFCIMCLGQSKLLIKYNMEYAGLDP